MSFLDVFRKSVKLVPKPGIDFTEMYRRTEEINRMSREAIESFDNACDEIALGKAEPCVLGTSPALDPPLIPEGLFDREYLAQFDELPDPERQTGRTTQQIQSCPTNSIYVAPHHNAKRYIRQLATTLGRDDLNIIAVTDLRSMRGRFGSEQWIELDHACMPTLAMLADVQTHNARVPPFKRERRMEDKAPPPPVGSDKPAGTEDAW